jgi:hypothetical protein
VRVPSVDASLPTSYFGGYLALIGLSQALLFLYLIVFYCRKRADAKHLRVLRLISCAIALAIAIAVLLMIAVKSHEYLWHADASDSTPSWR